LLGIFWRFSSIRLIDSVLATFLLTFDVVLVGSLGSPPMAASYAIASRYVAMSLVGLQAVLVVVPAQFSDLWHRRLIADAHRLYRQATTLTVAITWPVVVALVIFAPFFMSIFGSSYRAGATALVILALGAVAATVSGPSGAVLLMAGSATLNLTSTMIGVGVNLSLDVLLIPRVGLEGAAWSWALSMVAMNGYQIWVLAARFKMHAVSRPLVSVLVACLSCFGLGGVLIRGLLGDGPGSFGAFAVVSGTAYVLVLVRGRGILGFDVVSEFREFRLHRSGGRAISSTTTCAGGPS
jgi:O-antigen/teichoic acid export membrane protein